MRHVAWWILLLGTGVMAAAEIPSGGPMDFSLARPVWPEGRETERNLLVEFRAGLDRPRSGPVTLRLAASTLYRVWVNGAFAGHGPARAGHGFYRVDEWDLSPHLQAGSNQVVIEVAGYNANSYYLLDQPSFLQAELKAGATVLAATGAEGFQALLRRDRVQKVQRYSFQRPFSEIWRLPASSQPVACEVVEAKPLAPRRVPYPVFARRQPVAHSAAGKVEKGELPPHVWKDRSLTAVGPALAGFPEGTIDTLPSIELQAVRNVSTGVAPSTISLKENSFHVIDFGTNLTGFIGATVTASQPTRLFVTFDEILSDGDVDFKRMGCVNAVLYELAPGSYRVESFEPYTLRYAKYIVLSGECVVEEPYLREYANPDADRARFATSDPRYDRIFEAARQTFRQNATDVFMDCPSRERAGWLCDSFFTARVALDLCGDTTVEKNFFENYQRPADFAFLPEGMLPMCYPADHNDGVFIPNWAMWFVLQLEEYLQRSEDRELIDALRPRVLRLLAYLAPLENADGLLEKLPGWVFVEWSKANEFVQDVNYPSNMLYAQTLDAAGRLYALPALSGKAARIREVIREQAFDGEFFVDNAVRVDGRLAVTRNRTEVCQYFAFYFGIASPATHGKLWRTLVEEFGPQRKQTGAHPGVHPANAFIGNMLRFELLSRAGRVTQVLDETIGYWLFMADRTGTLWENDTPHASCNHGFASHAAHVFLRDVLGLYRIDPSARTIQVRLADLPLDWCEGDVPTPGGPVRLRWWKDGDELAYRLQAPPGFQIEVENLGGRPLSRR